MKISLYSYTDQLGQLWNSLADYYIRSGLFERARDIYEEAIQTVTTVRDFTQVKFRCSFVFKNDNNKNKKFIYV